MLTQERFWTESISSSQSDIREGKFGQPGWGLLGSWPVPYPVVSDRAESPLSAEPNPAVGPVAILSGPLQIIYMECRHFKLPGR